MKILFFVVCLSLAQLSSANDIKDGNEELITKIINGLSLLKSSKCQSDLNQTVNAFRERKPWAVASKNEFRWKTFLFLKFS